MFVQYGIDALLALHTAQSGKRVADDQGFEMAAVTGNGKLIAGESGTNPFLDLAGVKHDGDGFSGKRQQAGDAIDVRKAAQVVGRIDNGDVLAQLMRGTLPAEQDSQAG